MSAGRAQIRNCAASNDRIRNVMCYCTHLCRNKEIEIMLFPSKDHGLQACTSWKGAETPPVQMTVAMRENQTVAARNVNA